MSYTHSVPFDLAILYVWMSHMEAPKEVKWYRFQLRLVRERRCVGVEGGRPGRVPGQRVGQGGQAAVGAEPFLAIAPVLVVALALAEDPRIALS